MNHPAWQRGGVAVITGGASGIGLAAAKRFAAAGMRVCIADLGAERLAGALDEIRVEAAREAKILAREVDVSRREALVELEREVAVELGDVTFLMNNAGISRKTSALSPLQSWQQTLDVNLWGVVHGCQIFVPGMIAHKKPALVVNTGSKQGITTPPGNPAYNVSKAGVKAYTEALEHELRNTAGAEVHAHLLVPGFVFTGMTGSGQGDKPAGAWTAAQTIDFLVESVERGDFYILCPDNDVSRELDERRILWAAGDLVENRPALSRWHPDYQEAFAAFVAKKA